MNSNRKNDRHSLSNLLTIILLLLSVGLWGQNKANVHFEVDVATLSTQEQVQLTKLFKYDLTNAASIQLIGHTDADGSDAYNTNLSKNRVEFVRNQLIELGCPIDKITIDFKGEKTPLNSNKNDSDKAQNRRVEILWQKREPIAASSIQDLYDLLEQQKQTFCINPMRDTILKLDQGTIIVVPAGSFNTKSRGCVFLKTKEIYKYSDMLMENLSTTSNGRLLESAGMVYTEASDQDGNAIYLKKGAQITIMIPADTLRDDMELFTGNRDSETNQINWTQAGNGSDFSKFNFGHDIDYCNPYYIPEEPGCVKCGLFCRIGRIGRTIKGATNDDIKAENKEFRDCQKSLKKKPKIDFRQYSYSYGCEDLMKQYGVTTYEALRDTLLRLQEVMMQDEFEKYGVTSLEAYNDTLNKIRIKEANELFEKLGDNIDNGTGTTQDLLYYVARVNTMGWINCDAFSKFPDGLKVTMLTGVPQNSDFDCKLVFRDRKSIMRPSIIDKKFCFAKIPPGRRVWLMALKYEQGQAYISLHNTLTQIKAPSSKFRAVSIEELREELKKLDR
ncbi:MAG: hypothetical protein ACI8ZM_000834 [Crocinitomix sp.]|jgi:hypothetical protein